MRAAAVKPSSASHRPERRIIGTLLRPVNRVVTVSIRSRARCDAASGRSPSVVSSGGRGAAAHGTAGGAWRTLWLHRRAEVPARDHRNRSHRNLVRAGPVQRYSVPFLVDPKTKESVDHYDYSLVEYVIRGLRSPFDEWSLTKTTTRQPHRRFKHVGRNAKCPRESGRKYKSCCLREDGVLRPHSTSACRRRPIFLRSPIRAADRSAASTKQHEQQIRPTAPTALPPPGAFLRLPLYRAKVPILDRRTTRS